MNLAVDRVEDVVNEVHDRQRGYARELRQMADGGGDLGDFLHTVVPPDLLGGLRTVNTATTAPANNTGESADSSSRTSAGASSNR